MQRWGRPTGCDGVRGGVSCDDDLDVLSDEGCVERMGGIRVAVSGHRPVDGGGTDPFSVSSDHEMAFRDIPVAPAPPHVNVISDHAGWPG